MLQGKSDLLIVGITALNSFDTNLKAQLEGIGLDIAVVAGTLYSIIVLLDFILLQNNCSRTGI